MIEAEVGVPAPLELMLPDGDTTKAVQAYVQKDDGTPLATVNLAHMARGRYTAHYTFAQSGFFYVDFITYFDNTYTVEAIIYTRRSEVYKVSPTIDLAASFAAIPAAVWGYSTRLVTNDLSNLATHADVAALASAAAKIQYINKITTTFDSITGRQELLVWAEKDGQLAASSSNCAIAVKSSNGTLKWSASSSLPNSDGIYRFSNPISANANENYYIIIGINVDTAVRVNVQPFFTVG